MLAFPYQFNNEIRRAPAPWSPEWPLLQQAVDHCKEELKELTDAHTRLIEVLRVSGSPDPDAVKGELANLMDAAHDLRYVAANVLWALGVPLGVAQEQERRVHQANMGKLVDCEVCDTDGRTDEGRVCPGCGGSGMVANCDINGKILKPEGWEPPETMDIFDEAERVNGLSIVQMLQGQETTKTHAHQPGGDQYKPLVPPK